MKTRKKVIDMGNNSGNSGAVVMEYIIALDKGNYDLAANHIAEDVQIIGPVGESFGKPKEFTSMLKRYHGTYKILKKFVDGEDVSLLYEFVTGGESVYMSSWYKVRDGKIHFIRTVFDPSVFQQQVNK